MSKLQKCTLLKHAMVTADNAEQFILEGCSGNIKRGQGLIGQFPCTMGSARLYNWQHTRTFLVARSPNTEMRARQGGVAPQPELGLTPEGPWQDKTGMFAVEALELFAPRSYGSVPPTSGSACRLRYTSKSRFPVADLRFSKFSRQEGVTAPKIWLKHNM